MKRVKLPSGESVAALGQGTWHLGDAPHRRQDEVATLRRGIDLGLTLIDTAEMYGDGRSESLVGEAIEGRRDRVFLVSKVYPHNASARAMLASCNASLRRLKTEVIDLYLLHWPGAVPLEETIQAFETLQRLGQIRHWGVSNFDRSLMHQVAAIPGGTGVQTDQVLYHLGERGAEWDLLPWLRQHGIPVMAYSPIDQGRLLHTRELVTFSRRHGMTPAQAAIAWLLAHEDVIVIPKTASRERLEENAGALAHQLTTAQLRELDALFAPPAGPTPLAML
jgi:aldehyde reductase